ncbi:MAG: hypothetical protein WDZ62_00575 [Candidatus Pacearchaeota archaeon]
MVKTKKINLHLIGNEGNFNYYVFDKKQEVADRLSESISEIFDIHWDFYDINEKGNRRKIDVRNFKDHHESITKVGNNNRVDIFYGDKKMFVTIHCSQKLRLKFNEVLGGLVIMYKPRKPKK